MPYVVRIKKTGTALYVVGKTPEKKGDRFEATTVLETRPSGEGGGCRLVNTTGGGAAFSCSRRSHTYGGASAPVKAYVFDPELHEVEGASG
jgi:hypothetical protein